MIVIFYLIFFIIIFFKIYFIQLSTDFKNYTHRLYYKKPIKKSIRGNIYDSQNLLINFSKLIRKQGHEKTHLCWKREYLFPSCLSVVGLSNSDLEGLTGLEAVYNQVLKKSYTKMFFSKITNSPLWIVKKDCFKKNDIQLTIDACLSEEVFSLLREAIEKNQSEYGICIIMDGITGGIEVMTQFPQSGSMMTSGEEKKDFFLYPLSVTQAYEVGSVMKSFLMLSALEEGVVRSDDIIDCYGVQEKKIQGIPLSTWKAHGCIPFKTVIKESNNFGVAKIGLLLGEKLYNYYSHLGFGQLTGIPLPGETLGKLRSPSEWSKRSPISLSFGYEISCSLIQLVSAWSVFTNQGRRVLPRLLTSASTQYYDNYVFSERTIREANQILLFQKNHYVIAKNKITFSPEIQLYGKTGTANSLINGCYEKNSTKNKYSFIGHFEKNGQKKIVGIMIYGSASGGALSSEITVPLFFKIAALYDRKIL
jgi:cell division protein FtsI (penicillin-binding protein 3)